MNHELIGVRIARYRKAAGLTARELSDALGGSMSREVLANVESGRKPDISVDQLIAIAKALAVSPATLAIPVDDYAEAEWFCEEPAWYRHLGVREAAEILRQGWREGMSKSERLRYDEALSKIESAAD